MDDQVAVRNPRGDPSGWGHFLPRCIAYAAPLPWDGLAVAAMLADVGHAARLLPRPPRCWLGARRDLVCLVPSPFPGVVLLARRRDAGHLAAGRPRRVDPGRVVAMRV